MENPRVNGTATYFNLQNVYLSSTVEYRWCIQRFPHNLNRHLPFNPLDCFAIHFETVLILFLCVLSFWSPVYPTLARILHWKTARSNCLNDGMLVLSDLELPALPCIAPITAISLLPEYRLYYAHEIIRWPYWKMICHSQKHTRDHWVIRRKPFDFMQSFYTAL